MKSAATLHPVRDLLTYPNTAADARNGNVKYVDVLLADQIQQQIQRPSLNVAHRGPATGILSSF